MSTTLNNIQVNGTSYNIRNIYYGELISTASTAAKVATTSTSDNFSLAAGNTIVLSCGTGHGNTVEGAITLNVDGTGAKNVYYHGAATSTTNPFAWSEDSVLTFVYDGTNFIFIAMDKGGSGGSTGSGIIVQDENGNLVVSDIEGGVAYTEGAGIDIVNGVISAEVTSEDIPTKTSDLTNDSGFITTDTKNTTGATATSNKIWLVGATEQTANPQTYTNNRLYYESGLHSAVTSGNGGYTNIAQTTGSIQLISNDAYDDTTMKIYAGGRKTTIVDNNSNDVLDIRYDGTSYLHGLAAPTADTDAANKKYVDDNIPTTTSDLTNDSNFVSDASYVHTDNNYTSTEKSKLSGIASGAEVNVQANWTETNSSSDAYIKNKPNLATVATSGSYNDLSNKPTIPTATSQLTNDSGFQEVIRLYTASSTYSEAESAYNAFISNNPPAVCVNDILVFEISINQAEDEITFYSLYGEEVLTFSISENNGYWVRDNTMLARLDTPTFTGTPKAPTATSGTNTTQIATTAFVQNAINSAVPDEVYCAEWGEQTASDIYAVLGGDYPGSFDGAFFVKTDTDMYSVTSAVYTSGQYIIVASGSGEALSIEVNGATWSTITSDAVSAVGWSGEYSDLLNKPTIPTATSQLTNDSDFVAEDANGDISITRNINAGGDIYADGRVILDNSVYNVLTTATPTSAPSQDTYCPFGRVTHDLATTEEVHLAEFGSVKRATGESQIYMQAANEQNGTRTLNMLYLGVDANGSPTVTLNQSAWLNALGLTTTDWAYLQGSSSSTDKYVRWRAKSGIVFVEWFYTTGSGHSGSTVTLGTIPDGYRPSKNVSGACYGTGNNVLWWEVSTSGKLTFGSKGSSSSPAVYGTASYPL